jgi:hypothetical protein
VAAIRYGYGVFGTDPASERRELAAFAESFSARPALFWGSEESGELIARFGRDPRVQTENTGAERVQPPAWAWPTAAVAAAAGRRHRRRQCAVRSHLPDHAVAAHVALLQSVQRLIGGVMPATGPGEGPRAPGARGRAARGGALPAGRRRASLEPYAAPAIVERVAVYGGNRAIDRLQAEPRSPTLLSGQHRPLLKAQQRDNPSAYAPLDLGHDLSAAVWGRLDRASPTQRALHLGYVDSARQLMQAWATHGAADSALARQVQAADSVSDLVARARSASGRDTVFAPWLRQSLPALKTRLDAASRGARTESDRLHFAEMARQVASLIRTGAL